MTRWIFLAPKLDREISRFTANRVGGVERAGWIGVQHQVDAPVEVRRRGDGEDVVRIAAHAAERESCYRWVDPSALARSLPGLAEVGGPALVACMGEPARFRRGKQFRSFTGLVPKASETGETDRKGQAVSTTYDPLNRVSQVADAGTGTATYTYSHTSSDVTVAIGPAPTGEHLKQRQLEYDSLGRLTSVCDITSAAGSGACGQNSPQTGYWTKYTYDALGDLTGVSQNAQPGGTTQPRSYSYDAMSRLTSETNPENGTTTYAYDTDSTCSLTFPGDLVRKYDANGNT